MHISKLYLVISTRVGSLGFLRENNESNEFVGVAMDTFFFSRETGFQLISAHFTITETVILEPS